MLPELTKTDWLARAKLTPGRDLWLEYAGDQKKKLHPDHKFSLNQVKRLDAKAPLGSFYYCGPLRGKSLGLYSYLLDVLNEG